MGNSSSDEADQADVVDDEEPALKQDSELNNDMAIHDVAVYSGNKTSGNSGTTEVNVVRIGSYHQPVKVTKIENSKKARQEEVFRSEEINRITRNRFKVQNDNSSGKNFVSYI